MTSRTSALIAMVLLIAAPARAAEGDAASAQRVVDRIYAAVPAMTFDYRNVAYTKALHDLLAMDDRIGQAGGGINLIDWVPFCECQDTQEDYRFSTRATATPSGATVKVLLHNGGMQRFAIDLVPSRAGWLVADIHGPRIPSLLSYLKKNLPKSGQ